MKGLYVHIPFCVKKCEYCDFTSFSGCEVYFNKYLDMLSAELSVYKGTEVDTVFIGGGTPSILSSEQITRLCGMIRRYVVISDGAEITMEMNPGTVTAEKVSAMLSGGINRASVGVQSFNDTELRAIGRIHNSDTAYETIIMLSEAGVGNISLDLMSSLPYQTRDSFMRSLQTAVSLPVTHISVYSLIIEDGTPIKEKYDSGIYALPDDDNDRELYKLTNEFLRANGFIQYEISNYAKDGYQSRHNMKYWDCDEYIGIGLGAHSYIDGVRKYNTSELSQYLNGITTVGEDILTIDDKMGEFMMLGLRKNTGISRNVFHKRFGNMPECIWQDTINKFISLKLISKCGDNYALTDRGRDVSNSVMCEFLL